MTFRPAAVALSLLCASGSLAEEAPVQLAKTSPKTWSKHGWQNLRWGMGPGDVAALVSKKPGAKFLRDDGQGMLDFSFLTVLAEPLFDVEVVAEFEFAKPGFTNSGLQTVRLAAFDYEKMTAKVCRGWFSDLRIGLQRKYGKPICKTLGGEEQCDWSESSGLTLGLRLDPTVKGCGVQVTYLNPAFTNEFAKRFYDEMVERDRREEQKL